MKELRKKVLQELKSRPPIRDMETMDALIKIFFSNFTITPDKDSFRKGSKVVYELKEPYKGFLENGDFVLGAGKETLTPGPYLGKVVL